MTAEATPEPRPETKWRAGWSCQGKKRPDRSRPMSAGCAGRHWSSLEGIPEFAGREARCSVIGGDATASLCCAGELAIVRPMASRRLRPHVGELIE